MTRLKSDARSEDSLTILQVLFHSDEFIEKNIALTENLNPHLNFHWILVKNDQPNNCQELASRLSKISRSSVLVIPGMPSFKTPIDEGSYHHASGLQLGLSEVSTRFLLVMDPDFFVLKKEGISSVLNHMKTHQLKFMGSCWDPANLSKYRDFPSVHFMLIDLHQVPITSLDFTPDLSITNQRRKGIEKIARTRGKYFPSLLKPLGIPLMWISLWIQRSCSRDTGFRIYERFKRFSHVECFEFLGNAHSKMMYDSYRRFFPGPLALVGQALGILPKKITFEASRKDVAGVEKFQWKGRLFAVHFRQVQSTSLGINQKIDFERVLSGFQMRTESEK